MLTMNEIFSENLSKLLARRGIPQSALAEELGVSNAIVSEWVKGRKIPRMNKLSHICDFLQCDIDHLMKENGIDTLGAQESTEMIDIKKLNMKKVPLLGSVAAGEPICNAEYPGTFILAPMDCDFALRVSGESMCPTYMDGDIVYCKSCQALPHDGAIAVLSIGTGECTEHCIKHVIQADVGVVITSDNPAYPSKLVPAEQHPTILGIPVGFTRTHEKNPPPWKG